MLIHYYIHNSGKLLLTILCCLSIKSVEANVLYNDTLNQRPSDQSWLAYADNQLFVGGTVSQAPTLAGVDLITAGPLSAGYSNYFPPFPTSSLKNPSFPVLDPGIGFSLTFELKVNSESHSDPDRAGFSVILLGSDMLGIEIGFWQNQIWAQEAGFNQAESVSFDTVASEVEYELSIQNDNYTLKADGSTILDGFVRNYTAFNNPPYILSNYVFLGDNTSSAEANISLGQISLEIVPETSTYGLLLGLGALGGCLWRKIRVAAR